MDGTSIRCPTFIFSPIELKLNSKNMWAISMRKDENISFNKKLSACFTLFFNQVNLNEELLEETFEDFWR